MGYDDEAERSRNRRSRARQPVKRMGDREIEQRRYREPGHSQPGLNLITDTFREDGGRRQNYDRPGPEKESRRQKRGRKEPQQEKQKSRRRGEPEKDSGIYSTPARKKAKRRKRKIVIILFEVLILLSVIIFAAYSYVDKRLSGMSRLDWNPDEIKNIEISEEKQEQMKGYWTIAVFGVDSRNSSVGKGNNSDVNMVCNINMDTGEIKLVSVYRDTYLNISDKNSYNKINAAYLQGGPEQAVKALNKNLDMDIDDYATFNWKAVADAINILGGVDLEITGPEFEYINSFITETVESTGIGSHHLESAGLNHLDGVQAVAYCRLRLMDTDYQRTERQRKVISLALDKAKQADTKTLVNLVSAVLPQLSTDIGIDDVLPMAKNVSKYNIAQTGGFPFSRQAKRIGRMDCVIPTTLESNVIQLHQFLYGEENYKPSSKVRTISNKISEDSGLYEEGKPAPTGGSSSGGGSKQTEAPAQPAATEPVTEAPTEETTAEETVEETTQEETTAAETEPETTGEVGPGVTSTTEARETTSDSGESEGPGGKPVVQPTKAPEKETSSFAPGDGPGGNGGGGTPGGNGAPGAGEAPGGSGTPGGNSGSGSLSGEDGPGGGPGSN